MKGLIKALAILFIISQGCENGKTEIYRFTSSMDTLVIKTYKQSSLENSC